MTAGGLNRRLIFWEARGYGATKQKKARKKIIKRKTSLRQLRTLRKQVLRRHQGRGVALAVVLLQRRRSSAMGQPLFREALWICIQHKHGAGEYAGIHAHRDVLSDRFHGERAGEFYCHSGLRQGQNLFVSEDGMWDGGVYVPPTSGDTRSSSAPVKKMSSLSFASTRLKVSSSKGQGKKEPKRFTMVKKPPKS